MIEIKEEEIANDSEKFDNTFSNTEATFTWAKLHTVLTNLRSGEWKIPPRWQLLEAEQRRIKRDKK